MLALALRRRALLSASSASSAAARAFSQSGAPKRPRAVRVKKSEARRHVPDSVPEHHALAEVPPPPPPQQQQPVPFLQSEQQAPQTFGGVMKESFIWGMGMALAFSIVGVVFSSMEESETPGRFGASAVTEDDRQADE